MIPELDTRPTTPADDIAEDARRFAPDVNVEDLAFVLESTARAMLAREAPPVSPTALASTFLVAASILRGNALPPTPSYSRVPDSEVLDLAADRLAGLAAPSDLILAAACRRVSRELTEGMTATRAAADVWERATTFAARQLMGPPAGRQRFYEKMRAHGRKLWPDLAERDDHKAAAAEPPAPEGPPNDL